MSNDRYSRQGFLGENAQDIMSGVKVGVVGLGGGGSHIVQQLSHLGVQRFVLYDFDYLELSNLNRTIGGRVDDVILGARKLDIAHQMIIGLHPNAKVTSFATKWQGNPMAIKQCDIIFGCVDGYSERDQLERFARRYLIPYIDIGLDVKQITGASPRMAGQIILSLPGCPCMWCMKFLTEEKLAQESAAYGDAGPNPQVVYANGILASQAIGVAMDLLTGWTRKSVDCVYLQYDGNEGTLTPHIMVDYIHGKCEHYRMENAGDPIFNVI